MILFMQNIHDTFQVKISFVIYLFVRLVFRSSQWVDGSFGPQLTLLKPFIHYFLLKE